MDKPRDVPGVGRYGGPAGGWGALQAVARAVRGQMGVSHNAIMLMRVNQPDGFDCPDAPGPIRVPHRLSSSAKTAPRPWHRRPLRTAPPRRSSLPTPYLISGTVVTTISRMRGG